MKAGVLHAREDIRYEEVETPVPKAGEVLVKVKYSGICGSDVPRVNGDGAHFYPIILGHEFSGVVEEVGEGVTKVKKGQRVAGAPLVPCMKCEDCMKGDYALCKHYSFIGTRQPGSFAEYICVPEQNAVPFDDSVSFEQGALFEPAAVALHGLECLPYEGGKTVAVEERSDYSLCSGQTFTELPRPLYLTSTMTESNLPKKWEPMTESTH